MAMNRVQFQKGLSIPEFLQRYGTEQQCEEALMLARWPEGFVCPACGGRRVRTSFRRGEQRYWQCAGCQHQCSLTSGTLFEATKLPLRLWFMAMQLLSQAKNKAMSALSVGIRYPYDRKGKVLRTPSCVLKPSANGYLKPTG